MMPSIRIENNSDFDFGLKDLLSFIDGEVLHWRCVDYYGLGNLDSNFNVVGFENRVRESGFWLPITWREIREVAYKTRQIIDCFLVGDSDESRLAGPREEVEMRAACEIVLHLIDGGSWEITARDPEIIERIMEHFVATGNEGRLTRI